MKYYIQDSTLNKYVYFDTVPEIVKHLEEMVKRAMGLTRQQFTQNLVELGYGYDDADGVVFTRGMADQFNIGILNKEGKHIKTDIYNISKFTDEIYSDALLNRDELRSRF